MSSKRVYIVIATNFNCVGAFEDQDKAIEYGYQLMHDKCVEEGINYRPDEIEYNECCGIITLSHDETDYKITVDFCPWRT